MTELHILYSNRSASFLCLGDEKNALEDAERCVELRPEWFKGYYRLAQVYLRIGRAQDAYSKLQVSKSKTVNAKDLSLIDALEKKHNNNQEIPENSGDSFFGILQKVME